MDDFNRMSTEYSANFWEVISELQNITTDEVRIIIRDNLESTVPFPENMLLKQIQQRDQKAALAVEKEEAEQQKKHLLKDRIEQGDFFIAESPDLPYLRDDMASMENPLFALKAGDSRTIRYQSKTKDKELNTTITSISEYGRATIFDKDIWIYAISKLMQAKFEGKEINSAVEINTQEFFNATNRGHGGTQFEMFRDALRRLSGTRIETEIETGGMREVDGFGLLDEYRITERSAKDLPLKVVVQLPHWLYRSIQSNEVLPISNQYFRLRKPIDRRIYEIARKFCGRQPSWKISLEKLHEKTGATMVLRSFRFAINSLAEADVLPNYQVEYDRKSDMVTFINRDDDVQQNANEQAFKAVAKGILKKL